MSRDSVGHTLVVATLLCVVCSLLVSAAAVGLRPQQMRNRERERQKNILLAAGLYDENQPIKETFQRIETRIVDLDTGEFVPADQLDPNTFDQRKAARDEQLSEPIPAEEDIAGIKRRERKSLVYLVREGDKVDQIILPVYGKGLWSTMYGFLAVDGDGSTVRGITFYEHGETPGLGGEIDNERWQASWVGKSVFDDQGEVEIKVIKGSVDESREGAEYLVDGLAGATLTANGVTNLVHFWLGPDGFGPFLERYRAKGASE